MPRIFKITEISTELEIKIGSISSEVDKNIAIKVPNVITLPAYKLEAAAENPHCGNTPKMLPKKGPNFPDFWIKFCVLLVVLCSIYSDK